MRRGQNNPAKTEQNATTAADFEAICAGLSPQASAIYRAIFAGGIYGATVKEIAAALDIKIQSVSAQVSFMKRDGLIKSTASFRDAYRVIVADTIYDAERDGNESQTDRSFCSPLRDGKGRKYVKRRARN